jgi:hypothetical protein
MSKLASPKNTKGATQLRIAQRTPERTPLRTKAMIGTDGSHHKDAASIPPETQARATRTVKIMMAIRFPVRRADFVNLRDKIETAIAIAARTIMAAARGDPSI